MRLSADRGAAVENGSQGFGVTSDAFLRGVPVESAEFCRDRVELVLVFLIVLGPRNAALVGVQFIQFTQMQKRRVSRIDGIALLPGGELLIRLGISSEFRSIEVGIGKPHFGDQFGIARQNISDALRGGVAAANLRHDGPFPRIERLQVGVSAKIEIPARLAITARLPRGIPDLFRCPVRVFFVQFIGDVVVLFRGWLLEWASIRDGFLRIRIDIVLARSGRRIE